MSRSRDFKGAVLGQILCTVVTEVKRGMSLLRKEHRPSLLLLAKCFWKALSIRRARTKHPLEHPFPVTASLHLPPCIVEAQPVVGLLLCGKVRERGETEPGQPRVPCACCDSHTLMSPFQTRHSLDRTILEQVVRSVSGLQGPLLWFLDKEDPFWA